MNKYLIEFTGAFFLVLTIALTGNPIAIGAVLIAMIYMGGYISGAHYNPAVTLAVFVRGKISLREALMYMIFQVLGGFVAALIFLVIKEAMFTPQLGDGVTAANALTLEIIYTFALASVVLHVATSDKTKDNQYYGLAIGLTVMAAAFAAGPISGGVFNPAVAVGPILFDTANVASRVGDLVIYITGPLVGGLLAGIVYKLMRSSKK